MCGTLIDSGGYARDVTVLPMGLVSEDITGSDILLYHDHSVTNRFIAPQMRALGLIASTDIPSNLEPSQLTLYSVNADGLGHPICEERTGREWNLDVPSSPQSNVIRLPLPYDEDSPLAASKGNSIEYEASGEYRLTLSDFHFQVDKESCLLELYGSYSISNNGGYDLSFSDRGSSDDVPIVLGADNVGNIIEIVPSTFGEVVPPGTTRTYKDNLLLSYFYRGQALNVQWLHLTLAPTVNSTPMGNVVIPVPEGMNQLPPGC
jgi:hypothetical protein